MSTDIPFEAPWAWHRRAHRGWAGRQAGQQAGQESGQELGRGDRKGRAEQTERPDDGAGRPRGRGRGGRRHGGRFGSYGPGFGGPFGPGDFGPGFGPRGGRARRGDVRAAILALLAEEPMHGYQLIQEIARRSDGVWRPSAGSVYPALAQLEDEGLVRPQVSDDEGGKKVFVLTEAGQAYVAEHTTELAEPWDTVTGGVSDSMAELMGLIREVHAASVQVLRTRDAARVEQARAVLVQARRSLYLVLAGDEPTAD